MLFHFYDLNESELQNLRELSSQHEDDIMLVITKKAFNGIQMAELSVAAVELISAVTGLILIWADRRAKKKQESSHDREIAAARIEITMDYPDGRRLNIELDQATPAALKELSSMIDGRRCTP